MIVGDVDGGDVDSAGLLASSACWRSLEMSRSWRKVQAASRRSGVGSDMTPMVKCIAPTGRMAFGEREAGFARSVTSVVKREMEA